jgi:hypothetical protein
MPSLRHEGLLHLFEHRPALAAELVRDYLGLELPDFSHAELAPTALSQLVPPAKLVDRVVLLRAQQPTFAIIGEVQRRRDHRKLFTWPFYTAAVRASLRVPTCLLVVALNPRVAAWARSPLDLQPGSPFRPLVAGPEAIPWIRDPAAARRDPELAVLAAMCHGSTPGGAEVARAALIAAAGLDDPRGKVYNDLILTTLGAAARRTLEDLMADGRYEYQSDFARKYIAEGKAEGKAEGEARGRAEALFAVCAARGLRLTKAQRARVRACTDTATLDRWIRRAVGVEDAAAIFE